MVASKIKKPQKVRTRPVPVQMGPPEHLQFIARAVKKESDNDPHAQMKYIRRCMEAEETLHTLTLGDQATYASVGIRKICENNLVDFIVTIGRDMVQALSGGCPINTPLVGDVAAILVALQNLPDQHVLAQTLKDLLETRLAEHFAKLA